MRTYFARMEQHPLVSIIQENQFTSFLQPILSLREDRITAYECLLRPSPEGSSFRPFELFETARETGLHSFLDRSARISAIETTARLLERGIKRFVNFLPSSIYNPNYCLSHTFAAIDRLEQDPQDFVFEVVETEKIEDIRHLQTIFEVYKKNGMKVALDDVGSGFSTIEVMRRLEPDYVKIDRGLVDHCDEDESKQEEIRRIRELAHSYGGQVLAEGIERNEELAFCRSIGLDLAQGYLIGKPSDKPL
ncbi:EAL domain-containing protein [Paenibacillus sp. CC-CFT747]|nr:EAL domain-containing protein [Paenibacillus sp. CC-CFT747]